MEAKPAIDLGNKRKDYRDLKVVSIDPVDFHEVDDALSIQKARDSYRIGIHVADVAANLDLGSDEEDRANQKTESVYHGGYDPMFSNEFTQSLSLVEGRDRDARSIFVDMSLTGKIQSVSYEPTVINLDKNYSWDEFGLAYLVNGDPNHKIARELEEGTKLFRRRWKSYFNQSYGYWKKSMPLQLVSVYMLLGNTLNAKRLFENEVDFPRRSFLFNEIDGLNNQQKDLVSNRYAFYTLNNLPHEGVEEDHYAHSTSPLRRYADIMVQRQMYALEGETDLQKRKNMSQILTRMNDKILHMRTPSNPGSEI